MGLYEIMLIIRPDFEPDQHEEIINGLKDTITKNEGLVNKVVDWRKRRLAYEIDKHVEGYYYLVYFSGQGAIIPEIEHYFRVSDAILRYLVVRVEEEEYKSVISEEATEETEAVEEAEEVEADEATGEVVGQEESDKPDEAAVSAEEENDSKVNE